MPNKKNVLLILVSIVIIGGVFFAAEYKHGVDKQVIQVASVEKPLNNQITSDDSNKDSDSDGVKDWEETLWGLDPRSKDTNNTGIADDKKLAQLKSQKQTGQNPSSTSGKGTLAKGTKTDEFSKQFFTSYLELRKAGGGTIDAGSIEDLTAGAATNVLIDTTKDTYSLKNIKTVPDSDEAIKKYATAFAQLRSSYQKQYSASQIQLQGEEPNFSDPVLIKSFERAATLYKNLATELSKLSVPKSLAQAHVDILNAYIKSFRGLWAISATEKDPMASIKGLGLHTEAVSTEKVSLQTMAQFFSRQGIYFTSDEPGNFWNSI